MFIPHIGNGVSPPDPDLNARGHFLGLTTGTGRAALHFARAGAQVTGIDASLEMLALARGRAAEAGLSIQFAAGDAHALDFPDRSFDIAVSLRVLMHTPRWRACVAELCRVADRAVILDYPSRASAAALQSVARGVLYRFGWRTEPYRVLSNRDVAGELARAGFQVRATHRMFVLPIALHKAINSPRFTAASERLLARAGLLALLGSPATVVAERCERS